MRIKHLLLLSVLFAFSACNQPSKHEHHEHEHPVMPENSCQCNCEPIFVGSDSAQVNISSILSLQNSDTNYLIVFSPEFDTKKFHYEATELQVNDVDSIVTVVAKLSKGSSTGGVPKFSLVNQKYQDYDFTIFVEIDGVMSKKGTRVRPILAVDGSVPVIDSK